MTITRINYKSGNEKGRIELKGRFLIELRDNAFSETNGEDTIEHIENFLEIVDSLNVSNISSNQLKVSAFLFYPTEAASKWEDRYCNIGDLPGFIREGNSIRYEDYEWYDTIEDSELKEEALINKRILEESMNAMKESKEQGWFDEYELMGDDDDDIGYLEDYLIQKDPPYYVNEDEERSKFRRCKLLGIPYVKPPTCKVKKFELIWSNWSDTSIGAKDTGFRRGNQPKKLTQGYYAVTSIIKEDDFSESSLRSNIDDKGIRDRRKYRADLKCQFGFVDIRTTNKINMGDDVDINTLTMEQYLALIQDNIRPGIVKPKIGDDVEFEINGNFMKELRPNFSKGPALRWKNRLSAGLITTWDLLEKTFIKQYCPPFKTAKKLEEIRNFKQEMDETLYHAWERYNDLLYRCPQHDLNNQQKVHIFYIGLNIPTRIMLDSKGFIPLMTPTQALKSIQVMADHSHNCKICEMAHLTKECPLKKEDKAVEQSKYIGSLEEAIIKYYEESIKKQTANDEWIRKFIEKIDLNLRALDTTTKNLQEDEWDINDGWDITIKDVERLRQILTPTIHTLPNLELVVQPYMLRGLVRDEVKVVREEELEYDIPLQNGVMQPLTPQTVHIIPPDDDYVAPTTNFGQALERI
ncbi:reverse transcriptase domain-containing protein [Tanacetum coccineum]